MARLAIGNADEALDIVQDAMMQLAGRYADRSEQEWGALFYTILQNRISDWRRRTKVRNRLRVWFGRDEDDTGDQLENIADATTTSVPVTGLARAGCGANSKGHGLLRGQR